MWPRKRRDPRVRDELQFHRDRLIDDFVAGGMDRKDAERRAFLEFGNVAQIEEVRRQKAGYDDQSEQRQHIAPPQAEG